MKINYSIITLLVVAVVLVSCGGSTSKATTETATTTTESVATYSVDKSASNVFWRGEVAGVYGHEGFINIAEGSLTTQGNTLTGGTIVIDMKTIQPTDSASYKDEDGRRATDLVGHLSNGDFFLVEEFPTSSFVIKSQTGNDLVGDLTIRGITKEVKATLSGLEVTETGLSASAELVFNRQDFKVSWVHFMKDMVLSDDIKVKLTIVASKG